MLKSMKRTSAARGREAGVAVAVAAGVNVGVQRREIGVWVEGEVGVGGLELEEVGEMAGRRGRQRVGRGRRRGARNE